MTRPGARLAILIALAMPAGGPGCSAPEPPRKPRTQTWAELAVVRRGVHVTLPGERARDPYPRERLVDGEVVSLDEGALAWLRRDAGATLLVRGPGRIVVRADAIELAEGRAFVDTDEGAPTTLATPAGRLELSHVRASIDAKGGATDAYVLAGEVRGPGAARAIAGERLHLEGATATSTPVAAWDDWTGGLGTTDRAPAPAPFGVGTVGGRRAGDHGTPRAPLAIQKLEARVTIDGDFAVTEVDETFFNATSETVEGLYRFRTPRGATLHRFGVDRGGAVVWGRVKEKKAAAAQYQANVYEGSREDPALLEWSAPGVYEARLYPIGAGESRRVVVRYAEWLGRTGARGERRLYVYPMAAEGAASSLPTIEELTVRFDLARAGASEVRVGMDGVREGHTITVRDHDVVPRADLAIELFDGGVSDPAAFRAKHAIAVETLPPDDRADAARRAATEADYVIVRLRPGDVPAPPGGLDLVVVVDASAATDPASLAVARAAVGALLAHLGPGDRVAVFASDTSLRPVPEGRGALAAVDDAERRRVLAALATLERGGATDLGGVLADAAARLDPARRGAVVYVGDAVPTVGEASLEALSTRLAKLARPVRVYGLGVGDRADLGLLAGLARGGLAERIGDGASAARAALRVLEHAERPARLGASIDLGPSVERITPRDLGAIVADESLLVVGRATGPASPTSLVTRSADGATAEQRLAVRAVDDRGDLAQRWAEGRLAELLDARAPRAALVDLGMRHGIVTPFTSLYVPTTNELGGEERQELAARKAAERARRTRTTTVDDGESAPEPELRRRAERAAEEKETSKLAVPVLPRAQVTTELAATGEAPAKSGAKPADKGGSWGRDDSLGNDPLSARGNMWGDTIGDALGQGGLGLSGIGDGGGGRGEGLGLGAIGTIGHGAGTGTGQGFGSGHGRLGGAHRASPPSVRLGAMSVTGALPPEVVQRIVRQSFGRFRLCYEDGLRRNPNLQGRVAARFVIGPDGTNGRAANGGSDVPDAAVVACVLGAFGGLSFPAPESGSVSVVVPLQFSPEGGGAKDEPPKQEAITLKAPAPAATVAGALPRFARPCGDGASAPLEDRVALWRERATQAAWSPTGLAQLYTNALVSCEAPTVRERARLLSLLVDALATSRARVELWRALASNAWAADVVYRAILARVRTPEDARELHAALGLRTMDRGELAKALREAPSPADRARALRKLHAAWPDDPAVAIALLDALEDAGDEAGARALGRALRSRPDATAAARTAVGELWLRLAARASTPGDRAAGEAEARRAFGEIVEMAPDDPVARRWLGDLLFSHGFFAEALRQYETLAELAPDDTTVALSIARANEGLGRLEAALKWAERAGAAGPPGDARGAAATAAAARTTFLAWGALAAASAGRAEEARSLRARLARATADERRGGARVTLTWSHPELHPALWTNALGAPMPAAEGDPTLGIAAAVAPVRAGSVVEVRLEGEEIEHAARLGATALITLVATDGDDVRITRAPITFAAGGAAVRRFDVARGELAPAR